jgi:dTDP-4-amino-4,6-dideoxygalactose transaminase
MSSTAASVRQVAFLDLKAQLATIREEVDRAIREVLDSGAFIGGPAVESFEEEFARYCNAGYCVAVNSGTDALRFALLALGVGPGDEVLTAANTFVATTEAISQTGAQPVLVDVSPQTYTIDPAQVEKKITKQTRAIIPVHLYGQPAEMDELSALAGRHGIHVLEDACQAHGAEYRGRRTGSLAAAGCFSFYPGKNLGAYGEGGAVTSNDSRIAERVRMLRDHGQSQKYVHVIEGYNGRLDSIQCAVLRVKLRRLDDWNQKRRERAELYNQLLHELPVTLPLEATDRKHVYHLYVIRVNNRDRVRSELTKHGIHTGLHYPIPLHRQHAYAEHAFAKESFPVTEDCAESIVSLPMYAELDTGDIRYTAEVLGNILGEMN